jgi:hypothetical protein
MANFLLILTCIYSEFLTGPMNTSQEDGPSTLNLHAVRVDLPALIFRRLADLAYSSCRPIPVAMPCDLRRNRR